MKSSLMPIGFVSLEFEWLPLKIQGGMKAHLQLTYTSFKTDCAIH